MDLTSDIFTSILSPLAAFLPPQKNNTTANHESTTPPNNSNNNNNHDHHPTKPLSSTPWQTSPLNPQSRPNTLSLPLSIVPKSPLANWQLDGVDPTGRRFFATPPFALHKPPLRIDIYLPPLEAYPASLRALANPAQALYACRGRVAVADLEVGRFLGGVLRDWSETKRGLEEDEEEEGGWWWALPFGSFISVDFQGDDGGGFGEVVCQVVPEYRVEQGMLGVEVLRGMWEKEEVRWEGVEAVDWERLRFRRQVHEVISLVGVEGQKEREVIFKSVLQEQRYMYNELKMLLSLEPHPNVISRPVGVVTKKARFGNRRGVCGFLLEWFPLGSLRERLVRDDYHETTSMGQKLRWARQVTDAFVHVNGHARAGFYPDLKPDNIVLREDADTGLLDAVLIDLEQRGGWFAWSPPEVAYVEYLEVLADDAGLPDGELKDEIVEQLRGYYGDAEWSPGVGGRRYCNTEGGFSSPWLTLLKQRKAGGEGKDLLEQAQVFMLGKLLWCIFEGQPFVRCGIDHEVLRDAEPAYESQRTRKARAFPEFKNTPDELRQLIRACTAGAPEWDTDQPRQPGVVLRGGKLYPAIIGADIGAATARDTLEAARRCWHCEVERARAFIRELLLFRGAPQEGGQEQTSQYPGVESTLDLVDQVRTRPLFSEVLAGLGRIVPTPNLKREVGR
ncbi:U-box domain-protein 33 [Chaetomidium leptoderma]|uniref:U-box domain-protein 33 n=1 Tax=Chaetomidium leptoderma TaxID=669021 RepID=A0AAN6ZX62_9PEZI|nr:U-box domain-protein 33 [Chaetomidium leptoderma]